MDFHLGESDIVMNIPDDDPLKLSEGRNKEATEQPCGPKKEPEDVATPKEGVFGLILDDIS